MNLLRLVKGQDGRYAPYGGQTDPGLQAITALGPRELDLEPEIERNRVSKSD